MITSLGRTINVVGPTRINVSASSDDWESFDDTTDSGTLGAINETTVVAATTTGSHLHSRVISINPETGEPTLGDQQAWAAAGTGGHPAESGGGYVYDIATVRRVSDSQVFFSTLPNAPLDSKMAMGVWFSLSGTTLTRTAISGIASGSGGPEQVWGDVMGTSVAEVWKHGDMGMGVLDPGSTATMLTTPGSADTGLMAASATNALYVQRPNAGGNFGALTAHLLDTSLGLVSTIPLTGSWGNTYAYFHDVDLVAVGDSYAVLHSLPENGTATKWGSMALTWVLANGDTVGPIAISSETGIQGSTGGLFISSYRGIVRSVSALPSGQALVTWVGEADGRLNGALVSQTGVDETWVIEESPVLTFTNSTYNYARYSRITGVALSDDLFAVMAVGPTFQHEGEPDYGAYLYVLRVANPAIDGGLTGTRRQFSKVK